MRFALLVACALCSLAACAAHAPSGMLGESRDALHQEYGPPIWNAPVGADLLMEVWLREVDDIKRSRDNGGEVGWSSSWLGAAVQGAALLLGSGARKGGRGGILKLTERTVFVTDSAGRVVYWQRSDPVRGFSWGPQTPEGEAVRLAVDETTARIAGAESQ